MDLYEIKVKGFHLDLYRHVNNARYLEFLEGARWEYFDNRVDYKKFEENAWAFVIVNITINYRNQATLGDVLTISVQTKRIGSKSVTLHQVIKNKHTGVLVADADITFVIMDTKEQQAMVLNKELLTSFLTEEEYHQLLK